MTRRATGGGGNEKQGMDDAARDKPRTWKEYAYPDARVTGARVQLRFDAGSTTHCPTSREPCMDPMTVTFHARMGPAQQGEGRADSHVTLTLPTPQVGVTPLGASGTWSAAAHGVTALEGTEGALDPPGPTAATVNTYATPGVRPGTVTLVHG